MADYYSEERMRLAQELLATQGRLNDAKVAADEFRTALLDALGMDPLRDNDDIVNAARGLRRERDDLHERVDRIRELHALRPRQKADGTTGVYCAHCCDGLIVPGLCDTLLALKDGEVNRA